MSAQEAVKVAIELIQLPSRVRHQQSRPLPKGVDLVLRIAAGDERALSEASSAVRRPPTLVRAAAAFFVEQILFCPGADSYRNLGTSRNASADELRRNMALLLRWCHPDADRKGERSIFVAHVTQAWEDLKTPQRRAAYDKARHPQDIKSRTQRMVATQRRLQRYASRQRFGIWRDERKGLLRRALSLLLVGAGH